MSVLKALPFLVFLLAGCDRGTRPTDARAAPPAATMAESPVAPPRDAPVAEEPSPRASAPPAATVAPDMPAERPAPVVQPARKPPPAPVASAPPAPAAPAAPADEHAHHHHPTGDVAPAAPPREGEGAATGAGAETAIYTCPMHPNVQSNAPGRCPECGMNLVKK